MKRTYLAAAGGTLAVLGLTSFLLPFDGVAFAPAEGSRVTKTFEGHMEFALDEMVMLMNGEEQEGMMDEEPAGEVDYTLVVTDHFESMAGGRPTSLLRSIVQASGYAETSDGDTAEGSLDDFEGAVVRFAWNEEDGVYEATYEEGGGEEDALALLTPDMDYRSLLPRGDVAVDDEWEVSGDDFFRAFLPGMDVRAAAESGIEIDGEEIPEAVVELMDEFFAGVSATATYLGLAEDEGTEVAEIALDVTIDTALDIDPTEFAGDEMQDFGGDMEITFGVIMDLEGTLLWNQADGHFHSFILEGEGAFDMTSLTVIPDFDMELEMEMSASVFVEQFASAETVE